jgi:fructose-1,6-bisphosphatase-3
VKQLLAERYPTREAVVMEVAQLKAERALPRKTELFMSDIHGEYNAFSHVLRTGSGALREAIAEVFGATLNASEQAQLLATLAYPREAFAAFCEERDGNKTSEETATAPHEGQLQAPSNPQPRTPTSHKPRSTAEVNAWLHDALSRAATLAHALSRTTTPAQLRAYIPEPFAALENVIAAAASPATEAPMTTSPAPSTAAAPTFADTFISATVAQGAGLEALCALATTIQRLLVGTVHLVGDVYDRGPNPAAIMDEIARFPHLDIEWGNHDILWMGAALGQPGSVANVVRICARYGNLNILENDYGINLRPLATFAAQAYAEDPCSVFTPKNAAELSAQEAALTAKIQKAMALIQFKVEAALINTYPSFNLADRNLLHTINREAGTLKIDGVEYALLDTNFPTVNWEDPYALTPEEQHVIDALCESFQNSQRLQEHMRLFIDCGSLYKIENNNLILHACVPLNPDGSLMEFTLKGKTYSGKSLYDMVDAAVRNAFVGHTEEDRQFGRDMLWYLWLGPASPLFAKSKMATFELYFIAEKPARKEVKNTFYTLMNEPGALAVVFEDFGLDPETARIICGHVPVKVKDGEDPVKAGGRVICIDGGFSAAYQKTTGLAGFTLVSNSEGLFLDSNTPLPSREAAVRSEADIVATRRPIERAEQPLTVGDTTEGELISSKIAALEELL